MCGKVSVEGEECRSAIWRRPRVQARPGWWEARGVAGCVCVCQEYGYDQVCARVLTMCVANQGCLGSVMGV